MIESRNRINHYFDSLKDMSENARKLHELLISSTFDVSAAVNNNSRDWSICLGDIPITYSLKYDNKSVTPSIRLVVEPGGKYIDIPQQITWSMATLNGICKLFDWPITWDIISHISSLLHPKDLKESINWHGGMWIGMDCTPNKMLVKTYFNLKHREIPERWQLLATVLSYYGEPNMESSIMKIIDKVSEIGVPVGLGCSFGSQGLIGIRCYFSVLQPEAKIIGNLSDLFFKRNGSDAVIDFCLRYNEKFGPFTNNSVAVAFDYAFLKNKNALSIHPVRFKTEISVCNLPIELQGELSRWFQNELVLNKFRREKFVEDLTVLKNNFKTVKAQYLTIGINDDVEHMTYYLEPQE